MLIMLFITKMLPLANGLAGASDLKKSFSNVHIAMLWEFLHLKQMN